MSGTDCILPLQMGDDEIHAQVRQIKDERAMLASETVSESPVDEETKIITDLIAASS